MSGKQTQADKATLGESQPVDEVSDMLADAVSRGASDLHLEPVAEGYELRHRVDGLLLTVSTLDADAGGSLINRLMVAAQLLTYRQGVPQEGRITAHLDDAPFGSAPPASATLDLRLSVMPTTRGLRAVVRLPAELHQPRTLDQLGLSNAVLQGLQRFIAADSGMLVICGPAGAGKTTTMYALLEAIVAQCPGQSVLSLEDPVERTLTGVTQIEVKPFGELTFETVLRSVLRQDPQVLAVGEIRDAQTAKIAIGAALSGHRLVTSMHASSPQRALVRLAEMGLEPYQIASAVAGVVSLRLLRKARGDGVGYAGRVPVAEYLAVDEAVRDAVLNRAEASAIREAGRSQPTWTSFADHAQQLIEAGVTDVAEVARVLGDAS
jgi:type II secretory ATPase GspE/PulE/Tfp pilus assembly ATPase PilB-like protein